MKSLRLIFVIAALGTGAGLLFWIAGQPQGETTRFGAADHQAPAIDPGALRLALVPERDIFEQRRRHQVLADYLSTSIDHPIRLVTLNTYDRVLSEMAERRIDAAFVGSMVAVLAHDRLGTRVLANPRLPGDVTTYRGVLFVKADSPVQSIEQLRGLRLGGVPATTAGDLYPIYMMRQAGLLGQPDAPRMRWVGTHDDVIYEVMQGNVDAGACKNLRLDAWEAEHGPGLIRRLTVGDAVPNNALIVRGDMQAERIDALRSALLNMHQTEAGRITLSKFGALRFEPCDIEQFEAIYRMTNALGAAWSELGIDGPAPKPLTDNAPTAPGGN